MKLDINDDWLRSWCAARPDKPLGTAVRNWLFSSPDSVHGKKMQLGAALLDLLLDQVRDEPPAQAATDAGGG